MYKTDRSGPLAAEAEPPEGNDNAAGEDPGTALAPVIDRPQSTWRLVLWLAWPVLVQQFLILFVGLSDRFLAGYFEPGLPSEHVAYQAAQTTANYLNWFITSYTVLVSVGSTALVARFVGAGDRQAAIHVTNQSMVLAVLIGLLGTLVGLTWLDELMHLLQLHGAAARFAAAYLRPLLVLLVFQVIEAAGLACLIGAGDTRSGLYVRAGVALFNVPLAWMFFHGVGDWPGLGFEGIALGTAVSNLLGGLVVLALLARGRAGLRLGLALLRPDASLLRRLLRVSVPAGIDSLSVAVGHLVFLSIVNCLGEVAGSAHGIAVQWEALGFLSGAAFGTAAMTLVGQNLGAGRPAEAAHSGWVAFGLGCGVMCAMGVLFFILAPEMFAVFCPNPEQGQVIVAGVPVLRLVAFAMPAVACCIIFTYALRGAGDTRVPLLFTWVGFVGVRLPLAYWLTLDQVDLGVLGTWPGGGLGLMGAWLAMFADLVVRGSFFLYRFASGRWRTMRV